MKPREARRTVMISARLRHGSAWTDARILNISSRGMLVHAPQVPRRGTYVEICKGQMRIVARVIWAQDDRFGAQTQDRLAVDSITMGIGPPPQQAAEAGAIDRRAKPRVETAAERHERSRRRSRLMEFLCIIACGAGAAAFAFDSISRTLSRPIDEVSARLSSRK